MSVEAELLHRGAALAQQGDLESAIACFRTAVRERPNWPEALSNLGNALREAGRMEEATVSIRDALRIRPGFPEALVNLAALLEESGELEEARLRLEHALRLRPGSACVHNNLGSILTRLGADKDAVGELHEALRLQPNFPEALHNMGVVLDGQGRTEEAIRYYREALRHKPDYADAHLDLGLALLSQGDLPAGLDEYEWRWRTRRTHSRAFLSPEWDGAPLRGRRLLVHAEQGLGDTIQFIRYLELIREGDLILEVQPALAAFLRERLQKIAPVRSRVVAAGSSLPEFDCHIPLLSLPRLFRTTLQQIPNRTPYLDCGGSERLRYWSGRMQSHTGLRVGLVWSGGVQNSKNRTRSVPLSDLEPLGRVRGASFFSLQKGPSASAPSPAGLPLSNLIAETEDIRDTAAVILNLDLVISVDTLVAHLAGALGRPVWTLLSFAPDWRWFRERLDSPWYPTMRLFRQPQPGDWRTVVQQVRASLEELCHRPTI